jgi:hypothetical protein
MSWAIANSGSESVTLDTEDTLSSGAGGGEYTTAGSYFPRIDINNLADGEYLIVRAYTKARTGDTERLEQITTIGGHSVVKNVTLPPLGIDVWVRYSIEQTGGSARAFPWVVLTR